MHFLSHSKTFILSSLFSVVSFSNVLSMELIAAYSVSSAEPVQLFSNHRDIFVEDELAAYRVEKHNMNPLLKEIIRRKAMAKFTEKGGGYIRVKQLSDGKYELNAQIRVLGGGPITGACAYWGTKAAGWGAFAIGVWASHGELLLHTIEYAHMIEATATTAGVIGTAAPTP